ncbi:DNA-binding transcriptional dual regulator CueR [Pararobbsia alpina]|uniref:Cu(I)-responsive transcriptional regulator n=1 Tax=Pararobbsia alpina TaxID=621374 RepID=UPI0039A45597
MNIGQAAKAVGLSAKMIRYYESIGLVDPTSRTEAGYRIYREDDLHHLRFIRQARHLGFGIEDVRRLLGLWQDRERASAEVKAIALSHVDDLNRRIAEMASMRDALAHLASTCHGDGRPDCPILEGLADGSGLIAGEECGACATQTDALAR